MRTDPSHGADFQSRGLKTAPCEGSVSSPLTELLSIMCKQSSKLVQPPNSHTFSQNPGLNNWCIIVGSLLYEPQGKHNKSPEHPCYSQDCSGDSASSDIHSRRLLVVEPRGVEPLSEDQKTRASPSAVCILTFPPPDSHRQDSGFSSFIKSHRPQSLRRLVPCFYDADGLRRRRLRVDDRRLSGESYVIVVVSSF